jgi:hypothetical protein
MRYQADRRAGEELTSCIDEALEQLIDRLCQVEDLAQAMVLRLSGVRAARVRRTIAGLLSENSRRHDSGCR